MERVESGLSQDGVELDGVELQRGCVETRLSNDWVDNKCLITNGSTAHVNEGFLPNV